MPLLKRVVAHFGKLRATRISANTKFQVPDALFASKQTDIQGAYVCVCVSRIALCPSLSLYLSACLSLLRFPVAKSEQRQRQRQLAKVKSDARVK